MPWPRELERDFAAALLGGPEAAVLPEIRGDGLEPAARLAIYRHHVLTTLTEALKATYPVIVRLVDARFFGYAADRYIRQHPPMSPCLFEYGDAMPEFLATFPASRHLVYLPDVARLEWAINRARYAEDAVALDPRWLARVPAEDVDRLTLRLHPSVQLLASPWPVDHIWRASQSGDDPETRVSLDAGGARLIVFRLEDDVMFKRLTSGDYAAREALTRGWDLEGAVEIARATDPEFDLTSVLRELLDDGLLVGASSTVRDPRLGPAGRRLAAPKTSLTEATDAN